MRTLIVVGLMVLLVSCTAFAQFDADTADPTWRLRGGYFDMGDFEDGWGVGLDYVYPVGQGAVTLGGEWAKIDLPGVASPASKGLAGIEQRYGLVLAYEVWLAARNNYQPYLGLGGTWFVYDNGADDSAIGARVYGGADFDGGFGVQVGADFGSEDIFGFAEANGFYANVSYSKGW